MPRISPSPPRRIAAPLHSRGSPARRRCTTTSTRSWLEPRAEAWHRVLAGTNRVVRRRDRLHVARRVVSGLWDQSRNETPAVSPCVRTVGRRQGRSEDGRTKHALAHRDRDAGCAVRGRLTKLVAVVGSRRRRPAEGLSHVLGHRARVAGMSAPAGAEAGETASRFTR